MTGNDTDLIIAAVESVRDEVKNLDARVKNVTDDHETRLREVEKTATKFRAITSSMVAIAGFFGWDVMKHHLK